jgi:hypothetical protein
MTPSSSKHEWCGSVRSYCDGSMTREHISGSSLLDKEMSDLYLPYSPILARVADVEAFIMSSLLSRGDAIGTVAGPLGGPRRGGIYISPATVRLNRVFEQNRQRQQKKDGVKIQDSAATPQGKGKPRLLLMGQRRYAKCGSFLTLHVLTSSCRSGKSSISSVVFHKLPPNETLFLESTARIQKDSLK